MVIFLRLHSNWNEATLTTKWFNVQQQRGRNKQHIAGALVSTDSLSKD